jgi:hypothetical protein
VAAYALLMKNASTLALAIIVPLNATVDMASGPVSVQVETDYPFGDSVSITLQGLSSFEARNRRLYANKEEEEEGGGRKPEIEVVF